MRKHTWRIVLAQKTLPALLQEAFSTVQEALPRTDGSYELRPVTYDPITQAQFAVLTQADFSALGLRSVCCSSEEVGDDSRLVQGEHCATDYCYAFTINGQIQVDEEQGEAAAFRWVKNALEAITLTLPQERQHQMRAYAIRSIHLTLREDDEDEE